MSTIALNNLWSYIVSQKLSRSNTEWLIAKLTNQLYNADENSMPCVFTDEEWKQEVELSELEGEATSEEVNHFIEQEEDQRIDLISDEELAACYSVEEVGQRLRAMVHEHFANRTL